METSFQKQWIFFALKQYQCYKYYIFGFDIY